MQKSERRASKKKTVKSPEDPGHSFSYAYKRDHSAAVLRVIIKLFVLCVESIRIGWNSNSLTYKYNKQ